MAIDSKMLGGLAKNASIAGVAAILATLVAKLADFIMNEVAKDIDFLIRLVDTTCGK